MREFAKLGLTRSVGGVLGLALSRELTPVVTSIILAGAPPRARSLVRSAQRSCAATRPPPPWALACVSALLSCEPAGRAPTSRERFRSVITFYATSPCFAATMLRSTHMATGPVAAWRPPCGPEPKS